MIKVFATVTFLFIVMTNPTFAQQGGGPPSDSPGGFNFKTTLSDLHCSEDDIAVFSDTLGWFCENKLTLGGPEIKEAAARIDKDGFLVQNSDLFGNVISMGSTKMGIGIYEIEVDIPADCTTRVFGMPPHELSIQLASGIIQVTITNSQPIIATAFTNTFDSIEFGVCNPTAIISIVTVNKDGLPTDAPFSFHYQTRTQ